MSQSFISANLGGFGGGIYCGAASHPTISENIIADNEGDGGGIYVYQASPVISYNQITNNSGGTWDHGGGIMTFCYGAICTPIITYNLINGNSSEVGGGLCIWDGSSPVILNNTIVNNSAISHIGDGIYMQNSVNIVLNNCIVWNNGLNGINYYSTEQSISYCDIQDTLWPGLGNISADPLFLNPDSFDYHLTANSPCIDAGDPTSPLDPDSTYADMGALYYDHVSGVNPGNEIALPTQFALDPVHPNPFNPTTAISYQLSAFSRVSLKVYDTVGRSVATLVDRQQPAGYYQVTFDGVGLSSGIYFVTMNAGEFYAVRKMVLLK